MKRLLLPVVALLLTAPLLAIGGNTAAARELRRGLRVVPSADPAVLDSTMGMNLIARTFAQTVFETLFALDSHLAPRPMMVDREQVSPDDLTDTFSLRQGMTFHDGSGRRARCVRQGRSSVRTAATPG